MACQTRLILPDGRIFDVHGSCTLGRIAANSVVIPNPNISRQHALIQVQGNGECWIVDLGSSNGTYVNGRQISRPQRLKNGDVIDMAGCRIEFVSAAFESAPDPSPTGGSTLRDIKKRNCWLMVADIAGSTRMARELPPEDVPRITGAWFNTCREVIERHDGHMDQYLGDGYFCYWDDTPKATHQVLSALRELAQLQKSTLPGFRPVLHFGTTVLSNVPDNMGLNLHGQEVHFVFRMEKIAARTGDSVLCSEVAWKTLGVKSFTLRESKVDGYDGAFRFHVPDLDHDSAPLSGLRKPSDGPISGGAGRAEPC